MMKKYNNNLKISSSIMIVLVMLFSAGCSDDFIDEPTDTTGANSSVIFSDRSNVETYIAGILANYKGQYRNVDNGGLYAMYFARAVKGNDIIQAFSWYTFDYGHENREAAFRRTNFTWDFNYENINFANVLIDGVTNSATLSENDKRELIAQGKFFRGFHLFELLLEFAPNYNNDRSLVRIPIYVGPSSVESVTGNPPVPLSEAYNQVLQDLEEAIADLPDSRRGKSFVNKAVAQAVLTRVLAVTQDNWAQMSSLARASYGGNANAAVESSNWINGFNDMSDQEW